MKPDYYIVTFQSSSDPQSWHWEIRRSSIPMGVKVTQGGYQTQMAAQYGGKQELANFLDLLAKEEGRRR
jgi:hypothetical protein